jgi:YOP proteins translocation protein K (YscK)
VSVERFATALEPPRAIGARAGVAGLFDLQLKFNLFPAVYTHPSWSEHPGYSPPEHRQAFNPQSSFWIRRRSDALLRTWELDRQFDFDFSDRGKRLALLDAQTVRHIGGLAGALLVRDTLRRIVRGTDVASLQRIIGAEAYHFALRWKRPLPAMDLTSELCRLSVPWPEPDAWSSRSVMLVFAALPKSAAGVIARLRFKFPHDSTSSPASSPQLTEATRLDLSQLLIDIIDDECPEWSWLFDSRATSATHPEPIS